MTTLERARASAPARPEFTAHERRVIQLLAVPYTYEEIGEILGRHPNTIKMHTRSAAAKCGTTRKRDVPRLFMAITGENPYPQGGEPLARSQPS